MIGETFTVEYPFVRCVARTFDEESGPREYISWAPGTRSRMAGPEDGEDYANGIGKMHLTVISTHKPGRFPERVFYTREWETPEGKRFGKTNVLRITTKARFSQMCQRFKYDFVLDPDHDSGDVRRFREQEQREERFKTEMQSMAVAPDVNDGGRLPWE